MPIEFPCPGCNSLLRTPDSSAGKKAKCPQCGTIADVPSQTDAAASPAGSADTSQDRPNDLGSGPSSGDSPFSQPLSPGTESTNPFADAASSPFAPRKSADSYNPYATPEGVYVDEPVQVGSGAQALTHRKIEFGQVFGSSWKICSEQLGKCLLAGLVVIGLLIGLQVVSRITEFAALMSDELIVVFLVQLIIFLFNMVVQVFIQLGLCNFGIKLSRDGRAEVGDVFAVGPFLVRGVLLTVLVWFIMMGIVVACAVPIGILVAAMGGERVFEDAPQIIIPAMIIIGFVGLGAVIWISLSLLLAMPLIVDRNLGVMDSVRLSMSFMKGNKSAALSVLMVSGSIAIAVALFTCCIGVIFTYPYLAVVTATIYLMTTGQPLRLSEYTQMR